MENKTEKHLLKYEKVKNDIDKKIAEGFWDENEVILSEHIMCEEYGVSRITIRRAIDELVQEGKLYRIKGKGCFVSKHKKDDQKFNICTFSGNIAKQGYVPTRNRLSWEIIEAEKELAELLGIEEKDSVYVLKTLYRADGKPYCLNTSFIPVDLFPKLEYFDFDNNSLYQVLESFYDVEFSDVEKKIYAVNGDEETGKILENIDNSPLLKIDAIAKGRVANEERALEVYRAYMLTNELCFKTDRTNAG